MVFGLDGSECCCTTCAIRSPRFGLWLNGRLFGVYGAATLARIVEATVVQSRWVRHTRNDSSMTSAKDISDEQALGAVRATRGAHGVPEWATLWDTQKHLSGYPPKIVLAKLKSLIKRGALDGCACGCRGDFNIPQDKLHRTNQGRNE